jgi:hypothetical protein
MPKFEFSLVVAFRLDAKSAADAQREAEGLVRCIEPVVGVEHITVPAPKKVS